MGTLKYLGWCIVIGCLSCQKDNINSPVSIQFVVDINRSVGLNSSVQFLKGDIWLDQFLFRGSREAASDVNFSVSYAVGSGVGINFSNLFIPQLLFDIPNGSYTDIEVQLLTAGQSQASIDLSMEGTYTTNGVTVPIRVEIDEPLQLEATISNTTTVLVDDGTIQDAEFIVQPLDWLENITTAMLDTAEQVPINNVPTILISEEYNYTLYESLIDKVNQSNLVNFD